MAQRIKGLKTRSPETKSSFIKPGLQPSWFKRIQEGRLLMGRKLLKPWKSNTNLSPGKSEKLKKDWRSRSRNLSSIKIKKLARETAKRLANKKMEEK